MAFVWPEVNVMVIWAGARGATKHAMLARRSGTRVSRRVGRDMGVGGGAGGAEARGVSARGPGAAKTHVGGDKCPRGEVEG